MATFKHDEYSMDTYLNFKHCIPKYQRDYSWDETQLTEFWDDLTEATDKNSEHFFGMMVIHNDNGKSYIIDGQQRTITSIIFLSVIYHNFDNISKIEDEDIIKRKSENRRNNIGSRFLTGDDDEPKLTLSLTDNTYFREILSKPDPIKKRKPKSHERLRKAYYFFQNRIDEKFEELDSWDEKFYYIDKLYDEFVNRFKTICIEATDLNDAYTIFETLNARGKELSASDLLKNYLLSKSSKTDVLLKTWNSMSEKLDDDLTPYIRHSWNSQNDLVRKNNLYRAISGKYKQESECEKFVNDLKSYSDLYKELKEPKTQEFINNTDLFNAIKDLSIFGATSFYPLIIALYRKGFDEDNILKIADTIKVYIFRNIVIAGKTANTTEKFFNELACFVSNYNYNAEKDSKVIITSKIISSIKAIIINDELFESSMLSLKFSKESELIRYIFKKIHNHICGEDHETSIKDNNKDIHIEHIMPQNIDLWPGIDEETYKAHLWKIGNLTLLSGKKNREIQNKDFNYKKENAYSKSEIEPTKWLMKYEKWGKDEIEDRQKTIAKYALEIWKCKY